MNRDLGTEAAWKIPLPTPHCLVLAARLRPCSPGGRVGPGVARPALHLSTKSLERPLVPGSYLDVDTKTAVLRARTGMEIAQSTGPAGPIATAFSFLLLQKLLSPGPSVNPSFLTECYLQTVQF